jgi:hypothetical protein
MRVTTRSHHLCDFIFCAVRRRCQVARVTSGEMEEGEGR